MYNSLTQLLVSGELSADKPFQHEDWTPLLFACARGDSESVDVILKKSNSNINETTQSTVIPRLAPIHICAIYNRVDIMKRLLLQANINQQDQFGFTALHYGVVRRHILIVELLLQHSASTNIKSKNGSTVLDLALQLGYAEIVDLLQSKASVTQDSTVPQFRAWLCSIGAGIYMTAFISAGYDLPFIAEHGLQTEDLDCVGIPSSQLGIRKKLLKLHQLENYYNKEGNEGSDAESDDEAEESENEESGSDA